MKIDNAIKIFSEKYDRDAIQSIDNISNEYGLLINESTIKTFNMCEAFNIFNKYLEGYASYKIENINNPEATSQDLIKESVEKFINTQIFKETSSKYNELPNFITEYINGIESLCETVDNVKISMIDNDVLADYVGDVNEFTDIFIDKLHESFYPTMDRILWASGYNSKKRLEDNKDKVKTKTPMFL